jgi:uncharacterized phage-associated protein
MENKTKQIITYLIDKHPNTSVTALMKLCYLIDLVSIKETGKQITNFTYIRYNFGPFDKKIYNYLESLTEDKVITQKQEYTASGKDFIIYQITETTEPNHSEINDSTTMINKVLDNVVGHGAKGLTQIAYQTEPMIKIGAKIGNDNGMFQKLNLKP